MAAERIGDVSCTTVRESRRLYTEPEHGSLMLLLVESINMTAPVLSMTSATHKCDLETLEA